MSRHANRFGQTCRGAIDPCPSQITLQFAPAEPGRSFVEMEWVESVGPEQRNVEITDAAGHEHVDVKPPVKALADKPTSGTRRTRYPAAGPCEPNWVGRVLSSFYSMFWDSATELEDSECRAQWDRIADRYVRKDMVKRFYRDLGGRRLVRARYFRKSRKIFRHQPIQSLWPEREVSIITATVVYGRYHDSVGFRVEGRARDFSTIFIEEEGDASAEIAFGGQRTTLFFSQLAELLVLGRET